MTSESSNTRFLWSLIGTERWRVLIAIMLGTITGLFSLAPFLIVAKLSATLLDETIVRGTIFTLLGVGVLAMLLRFGSLLAGVLLAHVAAYNILYDLRMRVISHLTRVPLGAVTEQASGDIKKILYEDVNRIELFVGHHLVEWTQALVVPIASFIILAAIDWRMALAAIAVVPVALLLQAVMFGNAGEMRITMARLSGTMNAAIIEFVRGLPVIKSFNQTARSFHRYRDSIEQYGNFIERIAKRAIPFYAGFTTLIAGSLVVLAPLGFHFYLNGDIDTESLILFFMLGLGLTAPLSAVATFGGLFNDILIGVGRIRSLLDISPLAETGSAPEPRDAAIVYKDVAFSHGETQVLKGISFSAPPGTITALVGPSGAGKTTAAMLLGRYWDVAGGKISIGGVDIRDMEIAAINRHIAFVFQDVFLFDDTVANNIRVGRPDASDEEVRQAAISARAADFIARLPDGYETRLGERGARLSGGERQRLSIARAILKNAPVLVLDEATAFADPGNEALIYEALGTLTEGRTLIVIAHRLGTIQNADQIIVLDEGHVVGAGWHEDLLQTCPTYAALWRAQSASSALPSVSGLA